MTHLDSQEGPGSSQGPHRRGQVRHGDVQTETEVGPAHWERLEGQQAGACGMEEGGRSRWGCLQRGRRPADTLHVAPYIHSGLPTSKTMVTIHLRRLIQPRSQQQRVGNTQGPGATVVELTWVQRLSGSFIGLVSPGSLGTQNRIACHQAQSYVTLGT